MEIIIQQEHKQNHFHFRDLLQRKYMVSLLYASCHGKTRDIRKKSVQTEDNFRQEKPVPKEKKRSDLLQSKGESRP